MRMDFKKKNHGAQPLFTLTFTLRGLSCKLKYFLRGLKAAPVSNVHNGDVYYSVMAVAWTILNSIPLFEVYVKSSW